MNRHPQVCCFGEKERQNREHGIHDSVRGENPRPHEEASRRDGRPVLNVYLADTRQDHPLFVVWPAERAAEIAACSHERVRRNKTVDWQTLFFGLKESFALSPETFHFRKRETGGWTCDEAFFSLSHAGDFAVAAVSDRPVGVDLELERAFLTRYADRKKDWTTLRSKVYTPAERLVCEGESAADFLVRWTRKEAIFKQSGAGRFHPNRISADHEQTVTLRLSDPFDGILSVCGASIRHLRLFRFQNGVAVPLAAVNMDEKMLR